MSRMRRKKSRGSKRAPKGPLRIGLLTCLWQRPALTDVVLSHYAALRAAVAPDIELLLLAVGSEGPASRGLAERHGFVYVEHANQPLGAKWNAGAEAFREMSVEALLIVGSDDLLDRPYVEHCAAELRGGARFVGPKDMYFFDQATRRLLYWPGYTGVREGETTGLGRCIHRRYLEAVGWRLWEDGLESGLDRSMMNRLAPAMSGDEAACRVVDCRAAGFAPVDVKTATNLWSFDQVAGSGRFEYLDPVPLLTAHYPAALVGRILALPGARGLEVRTGASGGRVIWAGPPLEPARTAPAAQTTPTAPERSPSPAADTRDPRLARLLDAGEAAFAAGQVEDAEQAFRAVLAVAPTDPRALNDLAVVHHVRGETADAERAFLKAAIFDRQSPDPLVNLASIARRDGRLAEAAAFVGQALQLGGETPEILQEMAELTEASGDAVLARQLWTRARAAADAPPVGHRAAFVELDITPATDGPVPLQGLWAAAPRDASGVESPLTIQVLLLEDGYGQRALIVSADIFAFDPQMVDRVRAWAGLWGIAPGAVLLNASHTHYGPGTLDRAVPGLGAMIPEYAEAVCDTVGATLPALYQSLAPAKVAWGRAQAQIGFNRRKARAGTVVMAPNPEAHYETETPLLLVERDDGARCLLINHGCHPTGLAASSLISADFVGALRDSLRGPLGPGSCVMFLQGAAGDIKHGRLDGERPVWSADAPSTRAAGVKLAEAVAAALSAPLTAVDGPIGVGQVPFEIPLKGRGPVQQVLADPANAHVSRGMLEEWAAIVGPRDGAAPPKTLPMTAAVLSIGRVALCALPGEPVAEMARRLRSDCTRYDVLFVLGYTNGLQVYLPTAEMVREGGYEAHRSHFVYLLPSGVDEGVELAVRGAAAGAQAMATSAVRRPPPPEPTARDHRAFFVMSTGRSGTQTLAHLLKLADNAEVWHHPEPKLVEETLLAYWGALDRRSLFWQARGAIIRQTWDAGRVHGETDHNMTPFADVIAADVPRARFVALVRDPREFVRSGMRRSYYQTANIWDQGRLRPADDDPQKPAFDALEPFDKVCWLWAETYRRIDALTAAIGPDRVRVVRFEDLVAGPDEARALFEFLGLTGFDTEAVQAVLGQKLNAQKVGDFPHPAEWSAEMHARCWSRVGPLAERYGYARTYRRPGERR